MVYRYIEKSSNISNLKCILASILLLLVTFEVFPSVLVVVDAFSVSSPLASLPSSTARRNVQQTTTKTTTRIGTTSLFSSVGDLNTAYEWLGRQKDFPVSECIEWVDPLQERLPEPKQRSMGFDIDRSLKIEDDTQKEEGPSSEMRTDSEIKDSSFSSALSSRDNNNKKNAEEETHNDVETDNNVVLRLPIYPLSAVHLPSSAYQTLHNTEPRNIKMSQDLKAGRWHLPDLMSLVSGDNSKKNNNAKKDSDDDEMILKKEEEGQQQEVNGGKHGFNFNDDSDNESKNGGGYFVVTLRAQDTHRIATIGTLMQVVSLTENYYHDKKTLSRVVVECQAKGIVEIKGVEGSSASNPDDYWIGQAKLIELVDEDEYLYFDNDGRPLSIDVTATTAFESKIKEIRMVDDDLVMGNNDIGKHNIPSNRTDHGHLQYRAKVPSNSTTTTTLHHHSENNRNNQSDERRSMLKDRDNHIMKNMISAYDRKLIQNVVNDYAAVRSLYISPTNGVASRELPVFARDAVLANLPAFTHKDFLCPKEFWNVCECWQMLCNTVREARRSELQTEINEIMIKAACEKGGPLKLPVKRRELPDEVQTTLMHMEQEANDDYLSCGMDPCLDFQALLGMTSMGANDGDVTSQDIHVKRVMFLGKIISKEKGRLETKEILKDMFNDEDGHGGKDSASSNSFQ